MIICCLFSNILIVNRAKYHRLAQVGHIIIELEVIHIICWFVVYNYNCGLKSEKKSWISLCIVLWNLSVIKERMRIQIRIKQSLHTKSDIELTLNVFFVIFQQIKEIKLYFQNKMPIKTMSLEWHYKSIEVIAKTTHFNRKAF